MNKYILIGILFLTISCSPSINKTFLRKSVPTNIDITWIQPMTPMNWNTNLKDELIEDLKKVKKVAAYKFIKKYRLILEYSPTEIDTISSDGILFQKGNDYYKAKENIIQKYLN